MPVPDRVLDAYGFSGLCVERAFGGLINQTFRVCELQGAPVAALQRLHPVFDAQVNLDIEALGEHLARSGMITPRLLRSGDGRAWVECEGKVWRALTWIDGRCFSELPCPTLARSAAALVGRFHRATASFSHEFHFARPGVHDTEAHLHRLEQASAMAFRCEAEASVLRKAILAQAQRLPPMPNVPLRICHGDLKLANLLFDDSDQGLCLIDLDTVGSQSMAYELGDALRSWANVSGENHAAPSIDPRVVEQAALGYAEGSEGLLSGEEIRSVIVGLETICLELAARFCCDVFDDCYFGWDSSEYPSRRAHNLLRAQGQLALSKSVAGQRDALEKLWSAAF